ncbi:type II toxin-antitoxin system VapC family toxin [Labrys sp. LIt4]|nr:type II toxin-antitoxin system VapC family toxin [Labrys sp. LIt4]
MPTVTIAEIAFGIRKIRPEERSIRLKQGLSGWRHRFADRIFGLTEEATLAYGEIMAHAVHQGRPMSAPDGMIAAITRVNGGRLATRNRADFQTTGLELISPWDFGRADAEVATRREAASARQTGDILSAWVGCRTRKARGFCALDRL